MVRKAAIFCILVSMVLAVASCSKDEFGQNFNTSASINILTPWNHATREGIVEVRVDATDADGIDHVEVYANNILLGKALTEPYIVDWDMSAIANGDSTILTARAIDIYKGTTVSLPVKVFKGATTTPVVKITSPLSGAVTTKQGDPVTFKASATDADTALTETSFTWSSDLQGVFSPNRVKLQTADNFQFKGLVIGTHTITLSVTNQNGVPGIATTTVTVNPNTGNFAYIPAGDYYVGQPSFAKTKVTLGSSLWMSKTEMTVKDWLAAEILVYGTGAKATAGFITPRNKLLTDNGLAAYYLITTKDDPTTPVNPNYPATFLGYYEVLLTCNALSVKEGLTPFYKLLDNKGVPTTTIGKIKQVNPDFSEDLADETLNGYRLPTEAEWEAAARGGLYGKKFPWGDIEILGAANTMSDANLNNPINIFERATGDPRGPVPVKSYAPNAFDLYDMAGNVAEFVSDMSTGRSPAGFNPISIILGGDNPVRYLAKGGSYAGYLDDSQICLKNLSIPVLTGNKDGTPGIFGIRLVKRAD